MSIIKDLLGLNVVAIYTRNKAVPLVNADPTRVYGVELEIEKVPHWPDLVVPGVYTAEDGSLRDNGREFITKPMTYSVLYAVLHQFFTKAKLTEDNYSERTSVHVHANCQDLTAEQLTTVCLLYQVFEKVLFNFIGGDRDKNIFCVPWSETNLNYDTLAYLANHQDVSVLKRWQKYTALNLLPLFTQGTIEFRHMPGTADFPHIMDWINIIGAMFAYAKTHSLEETRSFFNKLNTNSEYHAAVDLVFKEWGEHLKLPGFIPMLEEGVLNFKYAFLSAKGKDEKAPAALPEDMPQINWPQDLNEVAILDAQARARNQLRDWAQIYAAPAAVINPRPRDMQIRFRPVDVQAVRGADEAMELWQEVQQDAPVRQEDDVVEPDDERE